MALTAAKIQLSVSWSDTDTPIDGARAVKVSDSLTQLETVDTQTYNRRCRVQYSLAAAGTQVIDLASFTDPYTGDAIVLTKAIAFLITGTQAYRIEPNAVSNPLPWFFGIAANYMTFGANEGFGAQKVVSFTTGSKLLLTNQGASTGVYDVIVIGGT